MGLKDLTVAEMEGRLREMSATTFDGVFVWRISDFAKKRQDAIAGRAPAMFSPGNVLHIVYILHFSLAVIMNALCDEIHSRIRHINTQTQKLRPYKETAPHRIRQNIILS